MRRHTTTGVVCTIEDVITSPTAWSCTLVATVTLTHIGSGGHESPDDYDVAECPCAVRGVWLYGVAFVEWRDFFLGPDNINIAREAQRLMEKHHARHP